MKAFPSAVLSVLAALSDAASENLNEMNTWKQDLQKELASVFNIITYKDLHTTKINVPSMPTCD